VILRPVQAMGLAAMAVFFGMVGGSHNIHAHPHVRVTVETEILHDEQKNITGFRHMWTFDELYSGFAVQGMDKNTDGQYDREELRELAEVNIMSLREFGFFTFPQLADHEIERLQPNDYWIEYKNRMLTLHFNLPLKEVVPKAKLKDFRFAVYDPTFYVRFGFAEKDPIRIAAGLPDCRPEFVKPEAQTADQSSNESITSQNDQFMNSGQQYGQMVQLKCGGGT
jgi:ABC-type uncharacterized transport system substrate-binding protein